MGKMVIITSEEIVELLSAGGKKGLKKGKDYLKVETGDPDFKAFIPLTFKGAKGLASLREGTEWYEAIYPEEWEDTTKGRGYVVIYLFREEPEEDEYSIHVKPNGKYLIYGNSNRRLFHDRDIIDFDVKGWLKSSEVKKAIKKARSVIGNFKAEWD